MTIDSNHVSAKWVDLLYESNAYHCFTDSKIVAKWLEMRAFISKY